MNVLFQQILTILITPPGNLVYHLVLAFSIAGSLQISLIQMGTTKNKKGSRFIVGFTILLFSQFILFTFSGLAWQGLLSPDIFLPPLDRAITALSLVWIIWLWSFPETNRPADSITLIISLLIVIGFGFTLSNWQTNLSYSNFNAFWLNTVWQGLSLLLLLSGFSLILIRRPPLLGIGLGFLSIEFMGYFSQFLLPTLNGNYPGMVRLAQLVAYPFLLTLPQQLTNQSIQPATTHSSQSRPAGHERRRYTADPKAAISLLQLAGEVDPKKLFSDLTHSISQVMLADICLLVSLDEDGQKLIIDGGYDLIREENLEGRILEINQAPLIWNAITHNHGLRLQASSNSSPDLRTLSNIFSLKDTGSLLAIPLLDAKDKSMGGILLLSPYSNRVWNKNDQTYLASMANGIAQIRLHSHLIHQQLPNKFQEDYKQTVQQVDDLKKEITDLKTANGILQELSTKDSSFNSIPELVNIERIVDHAISQLTIKMREKNISLRVDIPDELPQLVTDKESLQQVIVDLLENAYAVTPPEETIHIKIRSHEGGTSYPGILLQVTDKGGSITEEDRSRLFSVAGDNDNHIIQGVGNPVELAAAKALIEAQGGKMWVDCEESQSSTFNVIIPGKPFSFQNEEIIHPG